MAATITDNISEMRQDRHLHWKTMWLIELHQHQWPWVTTKVTVAVWSLSNSQTSESITRDQTRISTGVKMVQTSSNTMANTVGLDCAQRWRQKVRCFVRPSRSERSVWCWRSEIPTYFSRRRRSDFRTVVGHISAWSMKHPCEIENSAKIPVCRTAGAT